MEFPDLPATLEEAVARVEQRLQEAGVAFGHGTDNARDEAAWLVLAALGLSPAIRQDGDRPLDDAEWDTVERLLQRRLHERRPLAQLLGNAWFAGLEFEITPDVLVPRSPLAEPISERFVPWLRDGPVERILEIGTGSGCIAVACARAFPEAHIDATDIDPAALAIAGRNCARHGVAGRVSLLRSDVFDGLDSDCRYDLIISNPPYVDAESMRELPAEYRHEPAHALAAGSDGLAIVERILADAGRHLERNGLLVVETGKGAALLEERFPRTPFTWLAFSEADVDVFCLAASELPVPAG